MKSKLFKRLFLGFGTSFAILIPGLAVARANGAMINYAFKIKGYKVVDVEEGFVSELKANGAKFNYTLGWHFDHAVENAIKVNINTICHTDMFGAYTGYNDNANEVIETLKNEATPKTGEYVGTVGDKLNIKVTLTAVHTYYTNFTYRGECNYIFVFTDDNGNFYVWKTASYQDIEEGNNYILSGKIKEHKEYKGNRQNVLTRCKINAA